MKPRVDTSLGEGKEVRGRAQGRAARKQCRGSRRNPHQSREQHAEPARLLTVPDEGRMSSTQEHLDRVLTGSMESMESVSEEPGMELAFCTGDNDGIEEDGETPEELPSFPSELSVLEKLGLHSTNLTEQDVEAAFAHLALAFRCDMFTLQQRVQVEKRAQDAAEENIQEELGQCRTFLERLTASCMDVSCKEMLEQLQCSLAVLAAAIKRATSAAEKLGAVHQVGEEWKCWERTAGGCASSSQCSCGFCWHTLGYPGSGKGMHLHPERGSGGHRPWGHREPMAGPPGDRRHG
uniref:Uncharacterized protein n=1 Tax=Meleagris gallopavo TaxID=9103 RepID=A0A803XX76_MELGA